MAFGASLHALRRFDNPEPHSPDDGEATAAPESKRLPIFNFGKDLLSKRKQKKIDQVNEQTEMELKREKLIQSSEIISTDGSKGANSGRIIYEHVDDNSDYDDAAEDQSLQGDSQNIVAFDKHNFSKYIDRLKKTDQEKAVEDGLEVISKTVFELYKQGEIKTLSRDNIILALRSQANIKIGSTKASEIKKYIDSNYKREWSSH